MPDRIQAVIAVPRDDALPLDVQGAGLRRLAIERMQEVATVDENTVRMLGTTDNAQLDLGGSAGTISTWQLNLMAARFAADGKARDGVIGPVAHKDPVTRVHSVARVVRDEFAAK